MMGVGLAIASGARRRAVLVAMYLGVTLTAAVKSEEAFLRRTRSASATTGTAARRRRAAASDAHRRFSLAQAVANREHRAVIGLADRRVAAGVEGNV